MSWTTFPVSRSTQTAKNDTSFTGLSGGAPFLGAGFFSPITSSAVVTQTCLPRTTGDDQPFPWTAVFQRTFSVSLQVVGIFFESARPSAVAPRKPGQVSPAGAAGRFSSAADVRTTKAGKASK